MLIGGYLKWECQGNFTWFKSNFSLYLNHALNNVVYKALSTEGYGLRSHTMITCSVHYIQQLSQKVLSKLDSHMQRNEAGPLPNTVHKS